MFVVIVVISVYLQCCCLCPVVLVCHRSAVLVCMPGRGPRLPIDRGPVATGGPEEPLCSLQHQLAHTPLMLVSSSWLVQFMSIKQGL